MHHHGNIWTEEDGQPPPQYFQQLPSNMQVAEQPWWGNAWDIALHYQGRDHGGDVSHVHYAQPTTMPPAFFSPTSPVQQGVCGHLWTGQQEPYHATAPLGGPPPTPSPSAGSVPSPPGPSHPSYVPQQLYPGPLDVSSVGGVMNRWIVDREGVSQQTQREKNRVAAFRCRQKSKWQESELQMSETEASALNRRLRAELHEWREEVLRLKNQILQHASCDCPVIKQYISREARKT